VGRDGFKVGDRVRTRIVYRLSFDRVVVVPANRPFEWSNQNARRRINARLGLQTLDQLAKEFAACIHVPVLLAAHPQLHRQDVMRIESKRHFFQVEKTLQHEGGAGQQDESQRDLPDHERGA
jgi:hypothetical protein